MPEIGKPLEVENPVKEGLLKVIQYMRRVLEENPEATLSSLIAENPDFARMIGELESQKVDFSKLRDLSGMCLLNAVEFSYRENFNGADEDLRKINSVVPQEVLDALSTTSGGVGTNSVRTLDESHTLTNVHDLSSDARRRIDVWKSLSEQLGVKTSTVVITNDSIRIDGVGTFELKNDRDDQSYNDLSGNPEEDMRTIPTPEVMNNLINFMDRWSNEYKFHFLSGVMRLVSGCENEVTLLTSQESSDVSVYTVKIRVMRESGEARIDHSKGKKGKKYQIRRLKNTQ